MSMVATWEVTFFVGCNLGDGLLYLYKTHLVIMYLNSSAREKRRHSSMSPIVGFKWSLKAATVWYVT